jgi:amino acid adenylation domain-containing protein
MSTVDVLREIESRGLSISLTGGADLRLRGPRERMDTELIGLIKAHKSDLIAYLDAPGGFALTDLQRGYLIGRGEHAELGNVASHVYHEIEGAWDIDRLTAALRSVVARHGILRTRFSADGTQYVQYTVDVHIGRWDLRDKDEPARQEHRRTVREQRAHRILPADRAPLLAAAVTILADDRMVLHFDHDGLILDAISMFLLFREWWSTYQDGPNPGAPESLFESFVDAQARARTMAPARRSRKYWLERLDQLAPHPDLPLRTNPSAITVPRFTARFARLDATRWTTLKARAAAEGLTPSGLLFAAYAETLACWGAGPRFTLNLTVANRPPIDSAIHEALGNFGQTMLVEVEVDRRVSFAERARDLQRRLREGLDNRHFSGIEVLRELARQRGSAVEARMPYTFNSAIGYDDIDGSALELFGPEVYTASQTPQVWLDVSPFEQHGGLVTQFDSVDELFPDGLVDALVQGYQRLLDTLGAESAWSDTAFDPLPADQRQRRTDANATTVARGSALLQDAFLAHAAAAPAAPAVLTSTGVLSYGELYRRATQAAHWLRARKVARDELVGLVLTRGPEQIVGILATVLAGAAYLPIDATLPAERQHYLLADGQVRCVLTNTDRPDSSGLDLEVFRLDRSGRPDAEFEPLRPAAGANLDDLAYVLYTSGTTGVPKGVMVSQRGVANVVADCAARFGIGPADRFFGISAINFDLSVYDVFGALSTGAAIVLPDADRAADPAHWLELCAANGVSVWNSVPAIVSLLHEQARAEGADALAALRLVLMSGDRIPPQLPAALRALKPDLTVISLGGPTETTIWNIVHPVGADEDGSRSIPYGRPNANNRAYVVDADGRDQPDWIAGEIWAAGTGLARGYWRAPELTAERFGQDQRRGERLYRTGDLGRYLPTGEIDILGRTDFQLKVNGYRIEAGEVETRLAALDAVAQAVVARQHGIDGDRLVAHLVPSGQQRPSAEVLRERLSRFLPRYMVPAAVYWHESLPLTRNGKLDRARLADWSSAVPKPEQVADSTNSTLRREVAQLWADVLKLGDADQVPTTTALFDLGGDSLVAARILAGVRKRFGFAVTLDRLSEVDTVRSMAAWIDAARARKGSAQ